MFHVLSLGEHLFVNGGSDVSTAVIRHVDILVPRTEEPLAIRNNGFNDATLVGHIAGHDGEVVVVGADEGWSEHDG